MKKMVKLTPLDSQSPSYINPDNVCHVSADTDHRTGPANPRLTLVHMADGDILRTPDSCETVVSAIEHAL